MAIAWVDSSSGGSAIGSLTASMPKPAGLLTGHYMLVVVTAAVAAGDIATGPSGSGLVQLTKDIGATGVIHWCYTGFAGATEPASYDFTFNATANWSLAMDVFSGVDTTTPIDTSAETGESNVNDASIPVSALSTAESDDFQWVGGSFNAASTAGVTFTFPSGAGWTNLATIDNTSNVHRPSFTGSRQLSAASPAGFDVTASIAGQHATTTIALNAAPTGPVIGPDIGYWVTNMVGSSPR